MRPGAPAPSITWRYAPSRPTFSKPWMTSAGQEMQSHLPSTVSARAPLPSSMKTLTLPSRMKKASSTGCVWGALPCPGGTYMMDRVKCSAGMALASPLPEAPAPMKRCWARRKPSTRASAKASQSATRSVKRATRRSSNSWISMSPVVPQHCGEVERHVAFQSVRVTPMRGLFISVEGVEGSGKSTHCRRLGQWLGARGLEVVLTSEPDGTPLGSAIRGLFEKDGGPPTPLTQTFLFMAARQQHVAQVIRPALGRGAVVVSDRYADATLAYQGFGGGMDLETIRDLNALATGGVIPDLTILLDLDPAEGLKRISDRRLDAFEKMDMAFHRRVREGYLEIAHAEKNRVVVLSATPPKDELHAAVVRAVEGLLARQEARRGA